MGPDDSSAGWATKTRKYWRRRLPSGGAEEIGSGSGGDSGGAAEEIDQDGSGGGGLSGRVYPADWETKTKGQKKMYWKRRRPSGKGLPPP